MEAGGRLCYSISMRLRPWYVLAVLIIAGAACIIAWRSRPSHALDVGLVGSFTGRFASLGTTGRDGAILALEELNAGGGVLGAPLRFIMHDDASEGDACAAAYRALAAAGCRVVIGPFATGPATAALATIDRERILTIAPTVAGDNFTGKDDWFLRLYPSTGQMGSILGRMLSADPADAVCIVGDTANGPFLETIVAGVIGAAAGRQVVQVSFDSRRRPDLSTIAAQVPPAAQVLLVASSVDAAALAQRLAGRRLYCASWAVSKELVANGGRAIDGMRTVLPAGVYDAEGSELAARYLARFGEPITHVAVLHYEAVMLLAAAMRDTGSSDPDLLRRRLTDGAAIPGAPPRCGLDRFGDPMRPVQAYRYADGHLQAEHGVGR